MKVFITIVFLFQVFFCFGQNYIGKWTYQNQANRKVTIEFTNDSEYKVTIEKQKIKPVERTNGTLKSTKLRYRIIGKGNPIKVDIVSDYSNITICGIMELINNNTIRLQINPNSCGERPEKFDPTSPEYLEATRTY